MLEAGVRNAEGIKAGLGMVRPFQVWLPLSPAVAQSLMIQAASGTPSTVGRTVSLREALAVPAGPLMT